MGQGEVTVSMLGRLRRLRRFAPPAFLFAGLLLFGVSLLVLGTEATEEGTIELDPSRLTVANGTAVLLYPIEYLGERGASVVTSYAFPQAPGDAYLIRCDDTAQMVQGHAPVQPVLAFSHLRNGTFVASSQTVTVRNLGYTLNETTGYWERCDAAIAFQWDVPDGDPAANRPEVTVTYNSERLEGESFGLLAILMGASALSALLGGLAWAREGSRRSAEPPSDDSTVEALRDSLDRMGEQLERTRKHLLLGGVLGVFLWYPFLVPWAWIQADRASDDPVIPWAVAALTLAFLLALTVLWAREFLRLDRELNEWRGRMGELRVREEYLMDALEQGG